MYVYYIACLAAHTNTHTLLNGLCLECRGWDRAGHPAAHLDTPWITNESLCPYFHLVPQMNVSLQRFWIWLFNTEKCIPAGCCWTYTWCKLTPPLPVYWQPIKKFGRGCVCGEWAEASSFIYSKVSRGSGKTPPSGNTAGTAAPCKAPGLYSFMTLIHLCQTPHTLTHTYTKLLSQLPVACPY